MTLIDTDFTESRNMLNGSKFDTLDALESEAIHVFREVAGEFERPVILFSGGKDSTVLLHLAIKAFWPAPLPFPVLHIDTGHNFDEVIEYRDRVVAETGVQLLVSHVQDDIDAGRVVEELAAGGRALDARHPYTRGLLACRPSLARAHEDLPVLDRDPAWLT